MKSSSLNQAVLLSLPETPRGIIYLFPNRTALSLPEEVHLMPRRNLAWLLGVVSLTLLGAAVLYSAPTREKDKDYEMVRLMVDTLHEVRERYVTPVDEEREKKLVADMIKGGLERLDPHSTYIDPEEYKQFTKTSKGKFGGIGVHVGADPQTRNQLTVISPMPGTPAYKAGVLAGDVVLKIDGKATEQMRLNEAVDMIQGNPGQKITLTVRHEGAAEPIELTMAREEIHVPSVLGDVRRADDPMQWDYMLDKANKIGYIRLTNFGETTAAETRQAVEQLEKEGVRGLIIDLRNNPGGLLQSAVEICDLFLEKGAIVSTRGRNHEEKTWEAKPEGTLLLPADKHPMAVLVNRFSASASEIVSACLQDHQRATVIGERSYGKGSVQNIIMMEHGTSALKLTTASYWRPSGKNIHRFPDRKDFEAAHIDPDEWGVKPDEGFEVPMKDTERYEYLVYRSDRDIVREEKKEEKKEPVKGEKEKKAPFVDRVLQKALERVKGQMDKAAADAAAPAEGRDA
jgi:carboxyl-terminal processing protease